MYFSFLGMIIQVVISAYHSVAQVSMPLSTVCTCSFSMYRYIEKEVQARNQDKWIYFQGFIMPLLCLAAWTVDNLQWVTEAEFNNADFNTTEAYSVVLKSKWRSILNNMYFASQDTWKFFRTQKYNLQVSRNSNKAINIFTFSTLVLYVISFFKSLNSLCFSVCYYLLLFFLFMIL